VNERRIVVHGLLGIRIAGQRNRVAFRDQRGRGFSLGGSDQIHRAHLIALAPTTPVRQLLHHFFEVSLGQSLWRLSFDPEDWDGTQKDKG